MGNLCSNMDYYQIRAGMNFKGRRTPNHDQYEICSATVYIVRIDPSFHPFVIGSITNEALYTFTEAARIISPIKAATVNSKIFNISRNKINMDGKASPILQDDNRKLWPVWVSNETFFDHHVETNDPVKKRSREYNYTKIVSPVVHEGFPVTDADRGRVGRPQFNRVYVNQPSASGGVVSIRDETFKRVDFGLRSYSEKIYDLAKSNRELLGGAGLLVDRYISRAAYPVYLGGFQFTAAYSSGPIVARSLSKNGMPIYYLLYIRGDDGLNISWDDAAKYLTGRFPKYLMDKRGVLDPKIYNACVYDGGGSRQLWVRNQRDKMKFEGTRVPNYLCVWGSLPKNKL